MIEAVIFDLVSTLVQTERLKAISNAREAAELCPISLEKGAVIETLREVVGRSRRYVAKALVQRFDLAEKAMKRSQELGCPEFSAQNLGRIAPGWLKSR